MLPVLDNHVSTPTRTAIVHLQRGSSWLSQTTRNMISAVKRVCGSFCGEKIIIIKSFWKRVFGPAHQKQEDGQSDRYRDEDMEQVVSHDEDVASCV